MRKIRLRYHKKMKLSTKISFVIILIIISTAFLINYFANQILPVIMTQAKTDCKKMAILMIKNSLNDDVLSILEDDMFKVIKNDSGEIQSIDYNTIVVNKFLSETTSIITENLKNLELGKIDDISFIDYTDYDIKNLKNGVISQIPIGVVTNNVLLSNIGPKIPVKLNLIGNVVSNVVTKVTNYGINSALIEVYAKVEITEQVIIPFQTENIKVVNDIPITIKIVNGNVPEYFSNGKLSESSNILSIPIEND